MTTFTKLASLMPVQTLILFLWDFKVVFLKSDVISTAFSRDMFEDSSYSFSFAFIIRESNSAN